MTASQLFRSTATSFVVPQIGITLLIGGSALTTSLGITHAPRSRTHVRIDAGNRDRLVLSSRRSGCSIVLGALLLFLAAAAELAVFRRDESAPFIAAGILVSVAGVLLLSRRMIVLDRARTRIDQGWELVGTDVVTSAAPLQASRVTVSETTEVHRSRDRSWEETVFTATLDAEGVRVTLVRERHWERIRPVAEAVAAFLGVPLEDQVAGDERSAAELDLPLAVQVRRQGWRGSAAEPERAASAVARGGDEHSIVLRVPSPRGDGILILAAVLFVLWTIPVSLFGSLAFGLLPIAVDLAFWVKVRFGLGAVVLVSPDVIEVENHGIFIIRITRIATHELEDLVIRSPEKGGVRGAMTLIADHCLVARSDRAWARFGWGLERAELAWLREEILGVITRGDPGPPAGALSPLEEIPIVARGVRLSVVLGMLAGIIATALVSGPFALCIAAPFLEHIVSVGSLLGAGCGLAVARLRGHTRSLDWMLAIAIVAGVIFLLAFSGRHPLVQPYATFDEDVVAAMPKIARVVWLGWLPVATTANLLAAAVLMALSAPLLRWVARARRTKHANAALARTLPRWRTFALGLIPARVRNAIDDWETLAGGAIATLAGGSLIVASLVAPDESFGGPRWVVAMAGSAFFFAGLAIASQALPLESVREVIARIAAALLLTSFGAVACWASVQSLVFAPGAIILLGMAAALWKSVWGLFRATHVRPSSGRRGSGDR